MWHCIIWQNCIHSEETLSAEEGLHFSTCEKVLTEYPASCYRGQQNPPPAQQKQNWTWTVTRCKNSMSFHSPEMSSLATGLQSHSTIILAQWMKTMTRDFIEFMFQLLHAISMKIRSFHHVLTLLAPWLVPRVKKNKRQNKDELQARMEVSHKKQWILMGVFHLRKYMYICYSKITLQYMITLFKCTGKLNVEVQTILDDKI
jgi:hypothetical protein